uniref:DNA ligase n=1 Tax=Pseudomonas phage Cygsa01 TaxID=3138529 RepID=A0AAU6W402_9VIRU
MTSTTAVYGIIKELQAVSGSNAKKAILAANKDNPELTRYLSLAYDTRHNWYQTDLPKKAEGGGVFGMFAQPKTFWEVANELYAKLPNRAVSGNEALHLLQESVNMMSEEDIELLTYMIKRDIRAGTGAKTIASVFEGLFPVWHYMRCETNKPKYREALLWARGVFSQIKADGMFGHLFNNGDLFSREGTPIPTTGPAFAKLREALAEMSKVSPEIDFKLDGELLVKNTISGEILPREVGNGIFNQWAKTGVWDNSTQIAVYHTWDMISVGEYKTGAANDQYEERFEDLSYCLDQVTGGGIELIESKRCFSYEEVIDHYRVVLARKLEGLVVKCPSGLWKDGTSQKQIKVKPEVDIELEIVRFNPGEGKYANTWGSVTMKSSDDLLRVNIGASGFTWDKHMDINLIKDQLPGTIWTVRFNNIMFATKENAYHSLFLPRYIDTRTDKKVADTFPQIVAQFRAKLGLSDLPDAA